MPSRSAKLDEVNANEVSSAKSLVIQLYHSHTLGKIEDPELNPVEHLLLFVLV